MRIYALTDRGEGKKLCEDGVLLGQSIISGCYGEWESGEENFTVAVSDGVGGNRGGAQASFYILSRLREGDPGLYAGTDSLKGFLEEVNRGLIAYAAGVDGCEAMAATLTGLCVSGESLMLFHVGNTRCYLINGRFLRQVTTDHTKVETMVAMGMLTREEAADRPDGNVINACMGNADLSYAKRLEVREMTGEAGKRSLLLTSDGIHDYLSPDEMEDILAESGTVRERLEKLKSEARRKGSADDISVVFIERSVTEGNNG